MSILAWVLGLFKKPVEEVSFEAAICSSWPFPVESEKAEKPAKPKRKYVRKTATKKPATKQPAKKVAKKKAK